MVNQLTGEYAARNPRMEAYMKLAQKLFREFESAYIERFPRTNNSHADALTTLASAVNSKLRRTIEVEFLPRPSMEAEAQCRMVCNVETNLGVS